MNLSNNEKVQDFLSNLKIIDPDSFEKTIELRKIIFNTFPDVAEKIMYGGIIFSLNGEMFCGLFVYKNHISLEFSRGYLMNDPKNHLEGNGKFRRHLKFRFNADVTDKEVAFFVKQAVV